MEYKNRCSSPLDMADGEILNDIRYRMLMQYRMLKKRTAESNSSERQQAQHTGRKKRLFMRSVERKR